MAVTLPYPTPTNPTQWAMDYLAYIGAPAKSSADPRVKFLEQWINVEATFGIGNQNNPLDTSWSSGLSNVGVWNTDSNGQPLVRTYPSLTEGLQATQDTMAQNYDEPILQALMNPASTIGSLQAALGNSNWSGSGAGSANEEGYASTVGGAPSKYSGGTTGNPGTATASTSSGSNYIGPGGWLVQLDSVINPQASNDTLAQVLGPLDIAADASKTAQAANLIVMRGLLAIGSVGIAYIGFKILFGDKVNQIVGAPVGLGSSTAEKVSALASSRSSAEQAEKSRRDAARQAGIAARERERQAAITARERERHSHSLSLAEAKARAQAESTRRVKDREKARASYEAARGSRHDAERKLTNARARARRERESIGSPNRSGSATSKIKPIFHDADEGDEKF